LNMARSRAFLRVAPGLAWLALFGCSSILGIQDPSDDDGAGGNGSSLGGNSSGSNGNGDGGRNAGGQSSGGGNNGGSQAGGSASGGDADDTGAGGGSASGGAPSSPTVAGRIVDLFGRPLANTEVRLSGAEPALTDAQGRFTVEDVPEKYDAEFRTTVRDQYQRIYRFIGLTRRDPTFEFDRDISENEGTLQLTLTGLPTPQTGDVDAALGHPIDWLARGDETGLDSAGDVVSYDGEDPFATELHALFWKNDGVASEFYAHASQNIALNDTETTEITLGTWDALPNTGQLAGHIDAPGTNPDVRVTAYAVFGDGATLSLQNVPWDSTNQTFSLTVPDLGSQATFSVAAFVGDDGSAWGHADGFSLGASAGSINLEVPTPPLLQSPIDQTLNVTADTVFRWTPSDAGPCSLFVITDGFQKRNVNIVTCDDQVSLGEDVLAFLGPLEEDGIYWSVRSHGAEATTDEMTGEAGFIDPYFYSSQYTGTFPRGKDRPVTGTFARTESWQIEFE
jgi:hypothetical protein